MYLCRLNCIGPSEYYDVVVFVLKTNYKLCPKKCQNLKQASFYFTYVSVLLIVRKKIGEVPLDYCALRQRVACRRKQSGSTHKKVVNNWVFVQVFFVVVMKNCMK